MTFALRGLDINTYFLREVFACVWAARVPAEGARSSRQQMEPMRGIPVKMMGNVVSAWLRCEFLLFFYFIFIFLRVCVKTEGCARACDAVLANVVPR